MAYTIFFDLGNVLLYFDTFKMYQQVAQISSLTLQEVKAVIQGQTDLYEKGKIDTKKIYAEFNRLAKKQIDFSALCHALCDIFQPNQSVIDIAKELKQKALKLFILSNTCEIHFEFALQHFPFLQLFDGYVLSYKVGARKPEKKIFEEAIRQAGCLKERCFYTDDIPEFVLAAKKMKIDAEQFITAEHLRAQLHLRNLL